MDHQRMVSAPARMHQLLCGFEVSQALYVVAELGIATVLLEGPHRIAALAKRIDADADALERLIRFLAALGIFTTDGDDVDVTELGRTLADHPAGSMRAVARYLMQTHYAPFSELLHTVRTGDIAASKYFGEPFFDWITARPELTQLQNEAMAGFTTGGRGDLLDRLEFPEGETIADIGGSDGTLLADILPRLPGRRGIVFDLPGVVTAASSTLAAAGLSNRATALAGNFMKSVPTADIYVLSAVLHDWDDATAVQILRTIADATTAGAHLILIELVVPDGDAPHAAKVIDFTMMAMLGGRERTEEQWRQVLAAGGFTLDRITAGSGMYSGIEATLSAPALDEGKPVVA
jgi:O-methyltransferase domain/Dimerisation domain